MEIIEVTVGSAFGEPTFLEVAVNTLEPGTWRLSETIKSAEDPANLVGFFVVYKARGLTHVYFVLNLSI
jgi:hypothetical protein